MTIKMSIGNYDPDDYMLVVGGRTITGLGEGTPITAEKDEDQWKAVVGAQGEVSWAYNRNPLGRIEVTVQRTSPDLSYLIQLSNSRDTFPVHLIDRNTGEITVGGSEARIIKQPGLSGVAGDSVPEITFTIQIADYEVR